MATTVADEKKNLRAIMIACRAALPAERAAAMSEIVEPRVLASESYRDASAIVLYAAIGNEVSTDRILSDALASGRPVFYPSGAGRRASGAGRRARHRLGGETPSVWRGAVRSGARSEVA